MNKKVNKPASIFLNFNSNLRLLFEIVKFCNFFSYYYCLWEMVLSRIELVRLVGQKIYVSADCQSFQVLTFIFTRPLSSKLKPPSLSRISLHVELTWIFWAVERVEIEKFTISIFRIPLILSTATNIFKTSKNWPKISVSYSSKNWRIYIWNLSLIVT